MAARICLTILVSCSIYIVTVGRPIPVAQKTAARIQRQEYLDPSLREDLENITDIVKQVVDEVHMAINDAIGDDRIDTAVNSAAQEGQRVDHFVLTGNTPVDTQLLQHPTINLPAHTPSSTEDESILSSATTTTATIPPFSVPFTTDLPLTYSTRATTLPIELFIPTVIPTRTRTTTPPIDLFTPTIIPSRRRTTTQPIDLFTPTIIPSRTRTTTFPSTSSSTRKTAYTKPPIISSAKKCNRPTPTTPKTIHNYPKQTNPNEISISIEGNPYRSWQDWKTQDFLIAINIAQAENNSSAKSQPVQNLKYS